ncbi:hypothetical protein [Spirobacillus cienkowskii]|uniref:hypothetical protein n=1 Tax=Spirobacillus cienkowskii TaxID=495820 RepID=UPI0030D23127
MTRDQEIYIDIIKLLYQNSLEDTKKISMQAELRTPEGDVCEFELFCYNQADQKERVSMQGVISLKILRLLAELREFFLKNNQPYWKGCNFEVNLEAGGYEVNFIYE